MFLFLKKVAVKEENPNVEQMAFAWFSSNLKVSQVLQKTAAINSRQNDVRERCMRPLHVDNKRGTNKRGILDFNLIKSPLFTTSQQNRLS